MKSKLIALIALAVTTAGFGQKPQLFEASATTTLPANNITVAAGGNNFTDFVDSLINASGQFQLLDNKPFLRARPSSACRTPSRFRRTRTARRSR